MGRPSLQERWGMWYNAHITGLCKSVHMKIPQDERVEQICSRVAEGMTIRAIAKELGITAGRVIHIVSANEEASKLYSRARDAASDIFEADIIEAAREVTPSTAGADRVKIDALKWVAARRSPAKYSERIRQDHISSDGSMSPAATGAAVLEALARKYDS